MNIFKAVQHFGFIENSLQPLVKSCLSCAETKSKMHLELKGISHLDSSECKTLNWKFSTNFLLVANLELDFRKDAFGSDRQFPIWFHLSLCWIHTQKFPWWAIYRIIAFSSFDSVIIPHGRPFSLTWFQQLSWKYSVAPTPNLCKYLYKIPFCTSIFNMLPLFHAVSRRWQHNENTIYPLILLQLIQNLLLTAPISPFHYQNARIPKTTYYGAIPINLLCNLSRPWCASQKNQN